MKILHFGDIHFWRLGMDWSDCLFLKRWLGLANILYHRSKHFPPEIAKTVAQEVLKSDADWVIFSGDFTTLSLEQEFELAAEFIQPIREKWGERVFAIPGNHDRYTTKSVNRGVFEKYFPWAAFSSHKEGVRSQLIHSKLAITGFDCSIPFRLRSNGIFSKPLEESLEAELKIHQGEGRKVILVGHFPYCSPLGVKLSWEHKLLEADRLERLVAKYKPILYLHGHKHIRWLLQPTSTPETFCVDCGSSGMIHSEPNRRAGFVMLHINEVSGLEKATAHLYPDESGEAFRQLQLPLPETAQETQN